MLRCKLGHQEFLGFHALRKHKNTQKRYPIDTANVDLDDIINEVPDTRLKEELHSCQRFLG